MAVRGLCVVLLLFFVQAGRSDSDPWTPQETVQPAELAKRLLTNTAMPEVLMVGPRILFNGAHIPRATFAGPAGKPEGLENLTKAVASLAKGRRIVLYCGCCPIDKCPNIRPAFQKLKELGYADVQVLIIPKNLHDDWTLKGYPVEKGNIPQ